MSETLRHNWWIVLLRGILAIIFGVLAMIWPGITMMVLVILFGAYALVDGVFGIASAIFRGAAGGNRLWLVLEGILGVAVGIATFLWPAITELALLYLIAAWAIVTGVFEILTAIELRKTLRGEWLMIGSGTLSVLFGILLISWPAAGVLAVTWIVGVYALLFGVLLCVLAFRLRSGHTQDLADMLGKV